MIVYYLGNLKHLLEIWFWLMNCIRFQTMLFVQTQFIALCFCLCLPFFPAALSCYFLPPTACGRGFYKSSSQDLQCSRCPAHSFNDREGSWRCDCEDGYYRAISDPPSVACTSKSAMPLLGKHSTDHLPGSEFKQSHMWAGKKTHIHTHRYVHTLLGSPGQTCSVSPPWSHESPRCVPQQFVCLPVCHYNYVCRLACLFSVLAGC